MWVGSGAGDGLERGREVLAKWGYRRCEDVVWVKTNKTTNKGPGVRISAFLSMFSNDSNVVMTPDRYAHELSSYPYEAALPHWDSWDRPQIHG